MHVTVLPVFLTTLLVVCLQQFISRWVSPRHVLLFFSLACFALISPPGVIVLLLFSFIVFAGAKFVDRSRGRAWFILTIGACLLPLIGFKIYELLGTAKSVTDAPVLLEIIGISYFTFNGISYLVDIRRGYLKPENNYSHLLLYLSFFPCIAAGPLHRYKYLDAQFSNAIELNGENLSLGFRLVLWGLFKNLVLADRLKATADPILDNSGAYQGAYLLLGGLVFFFQIYCDFSSYVDVGMGFARMLGIQLSSNFSNRVYASSSRTEFWKGWHQTLNTWFRDYVFYPLVKGRANSGRIDFMLLVTFVLIGLWHGLSLSFLIWGLLNGVWIITETKLRARLLAFAKRSGEARPPLTSKLWRSIGMLYHMSISSLMALIFTTKDTYSSFTALFSPGKEQFAEDGLIRKLLVVVPLFLLMDQVNRLMKTDTIDLYLGRQKRWHRWVFYFAVALVIMAAGRLPGENYYYTRF